MRPMASLDTRSRVYPKMKTPDFVSTQIPTLGETRDQMMFKRPSAQPAQKNFMLARLSEAARVRLAPHLLEVDLKLREEIYQPEDVVTHFYFPHDCVLSLVSLLEDGASVEVGLVGYEGFAGLEAMLGGERDGQTLNQVVAQIAGRAVRVRADIAIEEFKRGEDFQRLALAYTRSYIAQSNQTSVSNVRRTLEQRLCRWLLMAHDRVPGDELSLTQEFLAQMLGVRRAGVSVAAGILQEMKMIKYRRGHVTILDREALEEIANSSYFDTRREFDRYLKS